MPGRGYSKYQNTISLAGDLVLLFLSFHIGYYFRQNRFFTFQTPDYIIVFLVYLFSWWFISNQSGAFTLKRGSTIDKVALRSIRNTLIHLGIMYMTMILFRFYGVSRLVLFYSFISELILILIWRISLFNYIAAYRKKGHNFRSVAIIGSDKRALEVYNNIIPHNNLGYKFVGFFSETDQNKMPEECRVYPLSGFEQSAQELMVDEVFCTIDTGFEERIRELILYCEKNFIRFKLVPSFQKYIRSRVTIDFIDGLPIVLLRQEPLESLFAQLVKRAFDIVFSLLIILLIFTWLFPILAILIKLESKGPVFFSQLRTGKENQDFHMLKFRSMTVNQEADKQQATKDDARITRMGAFMRKTSMDELPQFINVLKGDMSVVGPRPHMLEHTREYSELIQQYMVRHLVKPGITGWAQINGYRGATPEPELMRKRVEHDVWYLENWNFMLDLTIIIRTVLNMVKGEEMAF